ncbi:helix-turn-helix domain-containing protein [Labedaea rhizosphaerae]|uniref:Helix-turn-helix protein n=1 Tax=Labedaea rhizosphaerae TaxID=598644 RepID=A0A4R6SGU5_LABRH|nr:helix-turn-helix transcriptional regulator [Labedaea rhizosphaerae]TDQ00964.1 helix-turn-helix protein [Labedaea rhizosphaerae]
MGREKAAAGYRELGAAMRRIRQAAGLTGRQVARKTGWDPSRVSRIEWGQINIEVSELTWYLGIMRVDKEVALPLIDLCRRAKEDRGHWLSPHGEWVPDTLSSLIYHESKASVSIQYEPLLVPGLLQSEGYARALISRETWRKGADVDASVEVRLERQDVLARSDCSFVFYVHEHALNLEVGGPAVMYEQMVTLTLLSAAPNVDVHIVPNSAGERSVLGEAFGLFEFEDHSPLVHLDLFATTLWLEEPGFVEPYRGLLAGLADISVDAEESRSSFAALADKYERGSIAHADGKLEEK